MANVSWWSSTDYSQLSPLFPNPLKCVQDMAITGADELYIRLPWNGLGVWLAETKDWVAKCAYVDSGVFVYPILFAVLFTIIRVVLNQSLFVVSVDENFILLPCNSSSH